MGGCDRQTARRQQGRRVDELGGGNSVWFGLCESLAVKCVRAHGSKPARKRMRDGADMLASTLVWTTDSVQVKVSVYDCSRTRICTCHTTQIAANSEAALRKDSSQTCTGCCAVFAFVC